MNPLMDEYLVEEHRRDIKRELTHIRLQEQALKSRVFHPNWFTHTMQRFGRWLIMRGQRLVKRYEVPANCTKVSEQRYAN
ncbi:MAG TPA: hypothetical protein VFI68_01630 [Anaerolineales bacterium]|nr:hypothetical protein [Anaerolineales bacterium]